MNTNEYLEVLAEDLDLDEEALDEFVLDVFGEEGAPLDPSSYYFCFNEDQLNLSVTIFPKFHYDETGQVFEHSVFPVDEICPHLELESEDSGVYTWVETVNRQDARDELLEAGLIEMEL